ACTFPILNASSSAYRRKDCGESNVHVPRMSSKRTGSVAKSCLQICPKNAEVHRIRHRNFKEEIPRRPQSAPTDAGAIFANLAQGTPSLRSPRPATVTRYAKHDFRVRPLAGN